MPSWSHPYNMMVTAGISVKLSLQQIIYNYVKNYKNIKEEDIINIIYFDSPVSITKQQIKNILSHLVSQKRLIIKENNGKINYCVNNTQIT